MGCFLACFGFTKKRKRRKTSSKIISEDQSYGRYLPLDSDVTVKLDLVEMKNPNASATKLNDKPKESSASKIKKKVRFNLNVKSYEPLPNDDYDAYLSEGEEKTVWEFNQEERATGTITTTLEFEEEYQPNASSKIIGGSCSSYPANYRYQNCRNSYSEEDEIELDDSDFDPDDHDEGENDDDDNLDSDGEDDNKKLNPGSMESEKVVTAATARLGELGKCKLDQLRDSSSTDPSVGNKSQIVDSVLNPVENLTQWKAIKAKSRQQQTKQQKENIVVLQQEQNLSLSTHISKSSGSGSGPQYSINLPNLDHYKAMVHGGIAVDASLSRWLS